MSAHAFTEEPVPNFPGKHGGVIFLVLCNGVNDVRSGHFRFTTTDNAGLVVASLIEPEKSTGISLQWGSRRRWLDLFWIVRQIEEAGYFVWTEIVGIKDLIVLW